MGYSPGGGSDLFSQDHKYVKDYKIMVSNNSINQLKICTQCILPETFPGISFNESGVCNHCQREASFKTQGSEKKAEYHRRLDKLIKDVQGKTPTYDAIMAYSGGKDSSYTMKLLKERYDLRILAFTFDNHFLSPLAKDNIAKITKSFNIDHINFRPSWSLTSSMFTTAAREEIFPKSAMLRASSVCTACITLVKSLVLKTALEMQIPLVAFGWSPGQAPIQSSIMKTNPGLIRQNQKLLKDTFIEKIDPLTQSYFIPDSYYKIYQDSFPYNIHPLAFFDYNEEKISQELRDMGWQHPTDTDTNSTNCLINAFANQCHVDKYGFHPYVLEIANMVRQGIMTRDEGLQKIYTEQNKDMVMYARNRLGLVDDAT